MPSSGSICMRAAVPMAFNVSPPWPITMPFCESRSTTSEAWMLRQVALALDLVDHHGDRVRHLLARHAQRLLANQLRQRDLERLVGVLVHGIQRRPFGHARHEQVAQHVDALAVCADTGTISSNSPSSCAAASCGTRLWWCRPSILFTTQTFMPLADATCCA